MWREKLSFNSCCYFSLKAWKKKKSLIFKMVKEDYIKLTGKKNISVFKQNSYSLDDN